MSKVYKNGLRFHVFHSTKAKIAHYRGRSVKPVYYTYATRLMTSESAFGVLEGKSGQVLFLYFHYYTSASCITQCKVALRPTGGR